MGSTFSGGLRPILCANLPYNITTPLLTRVVESRCSTIRDGTDSEGGSPADLRCPGDGGLWGLHPC